MNDRQDEREELLSAFLDGELSGAARRTAEQALQEEPSAQRLMSDYEALSTGLRQLPKYRLGPAFRASVLARCQTAARVAAADMAGRGRWKSRPFATGAVAIVSVAALVTLLLLPGPLYRRLSRWLSGREQIPIARELPPSSGDAAEHLQYVAVPANGVYYLLVVDVTMTEEARHAKAFEQALRRHGIGVASEIQLDPGLSSALLKARMLEPEGRRPASKGATGAELRPDVYYVLARGHQIDALIPYLKTQAALFPSVSMDMAQRPAQLELFRSLRNVADAQLAAAESLAPDGTPLRLIRAQRLVWPESMSRRRPIVPSLLGLAAGILVQDDAERGLIVAQREKRSGVGPPRNALGMDMASEAIFVVRTQATQPR